MADKNKGGRPKKFKSVAELDKAIQYYFNSITKTELAFDTIISGHEDEEKKKPIYSKIPVLNNAGEQVSQTMYFENPSVIGMCLHIGIDRATLSRYETQKQFCNTIKRAKERIERHLEEQLYRKDQVTGIIFNLKNNFNWKDKQEIEEKSDQTITIKLEGEIEEWAQ